MDKEDSAQDSKLPLTTPTTPVINGIYAFQSPIWKTKLECQISVKNIILESIAHSVPDFLSKHTQITGHDRQDGTIQNVIRIENYATHTEFNT